MLKILTRLELDSASTSEKLLNLHVSNHGEALCRSEEEQAIEGMVKILTRLELDSAYTSEKLLNLHVLLMQILAWDDDLEGMGSLDSSAAYFEKALTFDLLCGILESELKEVDEVLDELEAQIVDNSDKLSTCKNANYIVMKGKLGESAQSLKQSRGQVSEITLQLAQCRRTLPYIRNGARNGQDLRYKHATDSMHRDVLRMLEKSLSRELELEKKLMEFQQNEEQLKLKLHYTEEASEYIGGRFLEAENSSEVFMGISKELVGRLQIIQFSQNGSTQREAELKAKLEDCTVLLEAKDLLVQKLEGTIAENKEIVSEVRTLREHVKSAEQKLKDTELELKSVSASKGSAQQEAELKAKLEGCTVLLEEKDLLVRKLEGTIAENREIVSEVLTLREAVKSAEQKLKHTELELKSVNAYKQEILVHLAEMENANESVKGNLFEAESKAESGETKIKELHAANLELREELHFLKDADDEKTKKVNSVEKQLRELEVQLENSKVSSEASQEQRTRRAASKWPNPLRCFLNS